MATDPTQGGDDLLLFDVQRFCVHDGPGIRTVVFLKGCPLRCQWCQNPESLLARPEIAFYTNQCAGCLSCADACPNGAVLADGPGRIDRSKCTVCGDCADACPHEALRKIGWTESPSDLLERVRADSEYYASTGGGVTLSGGEPLLQAEGAAKFLSLCRKAGINTVVETCGAVPWNSFENALPFVDLFYFDLKGNQNSVHEQTTGSPFDRIGQNARLLVESGANVAFRMPVVPGLNDSDQSLQEVTLLLGELGCGSIRLLPYHRAGEDKIDRIASGQPKLGIVRDQAAQALKRVAGRFAGLGVEAICEDGGPEPTGPCKEDLFGPRVWRLRRDVQSAIPTVCPERALLVTEYFRDRNNRAKPIVLQKAEALRHILRNRRARIHADELLVGCFNTKRVGGSILPELHGLALLEDLFTFNRRKVNPLGISLRDRLVLAFRVMPFWLTRFLAIRAFPFPKSLGFVATQLLGRRYLINETGGISHFVPDLETLLQEGTSGIAGKARRLAADSDDPARKDFYTAVEIACGALEDLATPYAELARKAAEAEPDPVRRDELEGIARTCERAPRLPARTLQEAFQTVIFAQIALNLESLDNSVCPGRLDQVLYPYYAADIEAGRIDEQGAREMVGCFTVKMSEIVPVFSKRITRFHGGMFNGQVVVVGGMDRDGKDATNDLTWMFLDAMDALRMRQPNYHARFHSQSPGRYTERVAAMLRDGSAAPALANDDVIVPMLEARGTATEDARDYSPVGCVEPVSAGASFASTDAALLNLPLALEWVLGTKRGGAEAPPADRCESIEEVIERFRIQIDHLVSLLIEELAAIERANARLHPTPLTSMLLRGCMDKGVDSTAGGALYNSSGVQGVGVADLADSFAAIEQVVFDRRLCDIPTLIRAILRDFAGYETLRGHLLRAPKYGNDDPAADRFAELVMEIYSDSLSRQANTRGGRYWAGFYSVTAHNAFGETTGALPSGRKKGSPLASGLSPANGRDRLGPTAALNSAAKLDLIGRARNGVNVNLKIDRTSLAGASGARALEGLIRGYFDRGGMQVQVNVTDPSVLIRARDDPGSHRWLLVRVSGYSAYFNDLSPGMKQEIIDRAMHRGG